MKLANVDLNMLVALDALLAETNVTRAAARTSVGQSAMSATLSRLRAHFTDPILVRQGRVMARTPFADTLVEPVRAALAAAEAAMSLRPAFNPGSDAATFTIMTTDYVTMVMLGDMFAELSAAAPRVRIIVRPLEDDFANLLRHGDVDLVIIPDELFGNDEGVESVGLFADRWVLVVDRDNPVNEVPTVEDLQSLAYVAYRSEAVDTIVDTDLAAQGIRLAVEVTTGGFVVTPFLVSGTHFASISLERLATRLEAPARLRILELPLPIRDARERAYWNSRHTDDLAHTWLRETILRFARGMDGRIADERSR